MTNREATIRRLVDTALADHPGNGAVATAAARVQAALDNDPDLILGPYSPASCFEWSVGLGSAFESVARMNHRISCTDWELELEAALTQLSDALAQAGDAAQAEVAGAAADESETAVEQSKDVTTPRLWENTPGWVKLLIGAIVADRLLEILGRRRG